MDPESYALRGTRKKKNGPGGNLNNLPVALRTSGYEDLKQSAQLLAGDVKKSRGFLLVLGRKVKVPIYLNTSEEKATAEHSRALVDCLYSS